MGLQARVIADFFLLALPDRRRVASRMLNVLHAQLAHRAIRNYSSAQFNLL